MTALPSQLWRALAAERSPARVPRGLDAAWAWTVGQAPRLLPRRFILHRRLSEILALESHFAAISAGELSSEAARLREVFRRGRDAAPDRARAFALVRETAARTLGQRPHPVQVLAALAIRAGCVAELATGEGKTLAATLPLVIAGWRGRGCHLITANDYLAARDARWMAPLYTACGVSVAAVTHDSPADERAAAYRADITYTTAREAAADFLRDRLTLGRRTRPSDLILDSLSAPDPAQSGRAQILQRGLECAIVDEADAVLIDDAVTPLILSVPNPAEADPRDIIHAAAIAFSLTERAEFTLDRAERAATLTAAGRSRLHVWPAPAPPPRRREELVIQALEARAFFLQGRHFLVRDDKVVIIDESTGRLTPDRSWRDGMHQAIEAANGLPITQPRTTAAQISFQRFFRRYNRLSGMTGTAREAAGEFWRVYRLPTLRIPTHAPIRRRELPDRVFLRSADRLAAAVTAASKARSEGRPALLGARSVESSLRLSEALRAAGLDHDLLNAENEAREADIIAAAGEPRRLTVATNMAGRGTDIRLGQGVAEAGGLHVLLTERHTTRRLDRQLQGRAGRQGDPGSTQALLALDDELIATHAPVLTRLFEAIAGSGASELTSWRRIAARTLWRIAERRASRLASRRRAAVLSADDWLDDLLGFAGSSA